MKYRQLSTAAGHRFEVPEHILRRDDAALTGWQLRYGDWTDYPDGPSGQAGAERALALAISEMNFRIDTLGK